MAINIKDAATDSLARELAAATGESLTVAVRTAIEERARRVRRAAARQGRRAQLQDYIDRGRARKALDPLSLEELLYDEDGLPS